MKAAAALVASARLFFSALRDELFYNTKDWKVVVVAYRQDATNSKLKQIHMEIECGLLSSSAFSLDCQSSKSSMTDLLGAHTLCCLSDVLPVEEATGIATVGMSLKMMESVGCFTWQELSDRFIEQKAHVADEKSSFLLIDGLGDGESGAVAAEQQLRQDVSRELLGKLLIVLCES